MEKKKILITGGSGFLGYHLLRIAYARGFDVYAIYNTAAISFHHSTNLQADLRNYIDMGNLIDDIEPDVVIHAAALTDANLCQVDKTHSYELNVEVTRNLAGICCDYQIPFVFTSTDLVFDGSKGHYIEEDAPNPIMTYGEHKLLAEREVQRVYPSALIARCPMMFGAEEASTKNYFPNFLRNLREGRRSRLFYDEYRSVCGARSVAMGLLHLCEEVSGIVHVAGPTRVSRYGFGQAVADVFGLNKDLLESCSQKDMPMAAPRPADVSLNIQKALSLGYAPLELETELREILMGNYLPIQ